MAATEAAKQEKEARAAQEKAKWMRQREERERARQVCQKESYITHKRTLHYLKRDLLTLLLCSGMHKEPHVACRVQASGSRVSGAGFSL